VQAAPLARAVPVVQEALPLPLAAMGWHPQALSPTQAHVQPDARRPECSLAWVQVRASQAALLVAAWAAVA